MPIVTHNTHTLSHTCSSRTQTLSHTLSSHTHTLTHTHALFSYTYIQSHSLIITQALDDFKARIAKYEEVYETITSRDLHYIKLIDMYVCMLV